MNEKEYAMISIVIPVYNAAAYLPDMLDSIIGQSYEKFEIILVNDGSTDNSSSICHAYADKHSYIHVYDRKNHGASASRNFGIEKASGEFVWFMDSDDILEKDALLQAMQTQRKCNADLVIGGMNFCFTKEKRVVLKKVQKDTVLDEHQFKCRYQELFCANYISSLCNKLIRRNVIIENNIRMNESLHMYEDYVFCMDILLKCKTVACISEVFYNYQLRETPSLSHRHKKDIMKMFCILEEKISEYRKAFGGEFASADASLNNLMIYLAYECVKNEARQINPYKSVKRILCDEVFHDVMLKYKSTERRHRIIQVIMKNKMALLILMYFAMTKKI